jgi:hypothetical protein
MDFIGLIKNALGAIAQVFGYAKQRDAEKNAPDMRQAAVAKDEAAAVDQTRAALAKKNLDELRKEASE